MKTTIEFGVIDQNFFDSGEVKNFFKFINGYSLFQGQSSLKYFSQNCRMNFLKYKKDGVLSFLLIGQDFQWIKFKSFLVNEHLAGLTYLAKDFQPADLLIIKNYLKTLGYHAIFYSTSTFKEVVELNVLSRCSYVFYNFKTQMHIQKTDFNLKGLSGSKANDIKRAEKHKYFTIQEFASRSGFDHVGEFVEKFSTIKNSTMFQLIEAEKISKNLGDFLISLQNEGYHWSGYLAKNTEGEVIAGTLYLHDPLKRVSYYFYSNLDRNHLKSGAVDLMMQKHLNWCFLNDQNYEYLSLMTSSLGSKVYEYKKSWANSAVIHNTYINTLTFTSKILFLLQNFKLMFMKAKK